MARLPQPTRRPASAYTARMDAPLPIGHLLRDWRQRRRRSQLDLAVDAEISTRHLSFVETGRARPSRALVLHLAALLELPLRERNRLLLAAGFAPAFAEHGLESPVLQPARAVLQRLLDAHAPNPALVVDRRWNLVLSNRTAARLMGTADPALLEGQPNVLRLSLHPQGLAPLIVNLGEWRQHVLHRLDRLVAGSGDAELAALRAELNGYPAPDHSGEPDAHADIAVMLRLRTPVGELALISTLTVFGSPMDVTLSELALESFFPADADSATRLAALASD